MKSCGSGTRPHEFQPPRACRPRLLPAPALAPHARGADLASAWPCPAWLGAGTASLRCRRCGASCSTTRHHHHRGRPGSALRLSGCWAPGCSVVLPTARQALGPAGATHLARPLVARPGLSVGWRASPGPTSGPGRGQWPGSQLHLLNLHYAQRPANLADPLALAVLAVANDAFRFAVGGWQLQAMNIEAAPLACPCSRPGRPLCPMRRAAWDRLPDELRPTLRHHRRAAWPCCRHLGAPGLTTPPRFRLALAAPAVCQGRAVRRQRRGP